MWGGKLGGIFNNNRHAHQVWVEGTVSYVFWCKDTYLNSLGWVSSGLDALPTYKSAAARSQKPRCMYLFSHPHPSFRLQTRRGTFSLPCLPYLSSPPSARRKHVIVWPGPSICRPWPWTWPWPSRLGPRLHFPRLPTVVLWYYCTLCRIF